MLLSFYIPYQIFLFCAPGPSQICQPLPFKSGFFFKNYSSKTIFNLKFFSSRKILLPGECYLANVLFVKVFSRSRSLLNESNGDCRHWRYFVILKGTKCQEWHMSTVLCLIYFSPLPVPPFSILTFASYTQQEGTYCIVYSLTDVINKITKGLSNKYFAMINTPHYQQRKIYSNQWYRT